MKAEQIMLGNLCEFKYGDSLPERHRIQGNIPVYGSNGVVGYHSQSVTRGETIIVGRKGSIGEVHYSDGPCFPIDTTYYISETKRECHLKWLYYILRSLRLTELNKSSAIPGLNRNDVYEKKIVFPRLSIQKQIAAILEKADAAREKRRQANKLTEQFLQSAFLEMFGDPGTNPEGWATGILNDAIEFSEYGTSVKSNDEKRGCLILGMSNVTYDGRIDFSVVKHVELPLDEYKKLKLCPGDVIFNRTNSTELVGKTAFWNSDIDAVVASYLIKLRVKRYFDPIWFSTLLNTAYYKKLFMQRCKKAVGQSNISPTLLKEFPMYKPPLPEQQKFASLVEKVELQRVKQRESEKELENLFQSLMQRAFKGELVQ